MTEKSTHFGYRSVSEAEKSGLVGQVFHSVASRYDLMNDLMSLGAHRAWKTFAANLSGIRPGQQVLDVAGGSGDMTARFVRRLHGKGQVVLSDINPSMLAVGRNRLLDQGITTRVDYCLADAEKLPFVSNHFDCVSISFGLRNVTRIQEALNSMYRVLKPGGRLLILEFSRPGAAILRQIYDRYSFSVLPRLGKFVARDENSYQYLVESIRKHPSQEPLRQMCIKSGFERVRYHNLSGGIVALHIGYKLRCSPQV